MHFKDCHVTVLFGVQQSLSPAIHSVQTAHACFIPLSRSLALQALNSRPYFNLPGFEASSLLN